MIWVSGDDLAPSASSRMRQAELLGTPSQSTLLRTPAANDVFWK
jgi:hypothetical protein